MCARGGPPCASRVPHSSLELFSFSVALCIAPLELTTRPNVGVNNRYITRDPTRKDPAWGFRRRMSKASTRRADLRACSSNVYTTHGDLGGVCFVVHSLVDLTQRRDSDDKYLTMCFVHKGADGCPNGISCFDIVAASVPWASRVHGSEFMPT